MPTDNVTFYDQNTGNSYSFPPPAFGYKTTIEMQVDYQEIGLGQLVLFDHGYIYNNRYCDCKFILSTAASISEMGGMLSAHNTSPLSGGDKYPFILQLSASSGFYPMGPDKGDAGDFTVLIDPKIENGAILSKDYDGKAVEFNMRIYNAGVYPSYSFLVETSNDGPFAIDDISGMRYPTSWFTSVRETPRQHIHPGYNNPTNYVYQTRNTNNAMKPAVESKFHLVLATDKAQRLVDSITEGDIRVNHLSVSIASSYYEFGYDYNNSTYGSKIIHQDKIEITHSNYNKFEFDLAVVAQPYDATLTIPDIDPEFNLDVIESIPRVTEDEGIITEY